MRSKIRGVFFLLVLVTALAACGGSPAIVAPVAGTQGAAAAPELGVVKLNAHPGSLEGKIVLLRWNGKPNGDVFLNRVAELLTQQTPGVKVVKLWELDPSTAATSKTGEASQKVVETIASYKPDLVIASQSDGGNCTHALMVDQLRVEQKGIPTVTIVTTSYELLASETMAQQGGVELAIVVVEHPIAGHKADAVRAKVDAAFPEIMKAATVWQPAK